MQNEVLSVTELQSLINQTLDYAYRDIYVEGEVASFKINQNKWVFFDIKDSDTTLSCFMTKYQLHVPLEDGMLVKLHCTPNITKWGKFSLTVRSLELSGEGSVKKAFEILRAQLDQEGIFAPERKRLLPEYPERIVLITSAQAAAYNDFLTILHDRWSGLQIDHLQVQVQGESAPDQLVEALHYCNTHSANHDVVAVIRGGGSAEDLQAFNNELVVRAVYGCKIPTVIGIGHEDDVSLAELAADQRAATPTDAARRLVPDKKVLIQTLDRTLESQFTHMKKHLQSNYEKIGTLGHSLAMVVARLRSRLSESIGGLENGLSAILQRNTNSVQRLQQLLRSLDPHAILKRGYAIATIDGKVLHNAEQARSDDVIMLQLGQGALATKPVQKGASNDKRAKHGKEIEQDRLF